VEEGLLMNKYQKGLWFIAWFNNVIAFIEIKRKLAENVNTPKQSNNELFSTVIARPLTLKITI
jgi:hypothetical protein